MQYVLATLAALGTAAVAAPWGENYGGHEEHHGGWKGNGHNEDGGYHAGNGAGSSNNNGITDAQILNYALTLEHLEDKFYREGLANFTQADFVAAGFPDPYYKYLRTVSYDETTHVNFLTSALQAAGATPVAECTYDFGNLTPKSFVQTASILEGVGVSAYLGAASSIANKMYLTAAGSILTTEARHSGFQRAALGEVPFASPFDVPLDFDEVYTLAAPFIVSCPASNPPLPVMAFPSLALDPATAMPIMEGSAVTFDLMKALPMDKKYYGAWITVTGPVFVPTTVKDKKVMTTVPKGALVDGQSYFVLTKDDKTVNDETIVAGPGIAEVTPPAR